MNKPIDTYKKVKTSQDVSQYRAVALLLDGAIERVKLARQAQTEGNSEVRGLAVGTTITILGVLQASLDKQLGGEIAENLDVLYAYMTRRLAGAAIEREAGSLEEVEALLVQLQEAWAGIEVEVEPSAS
ncbi:flagellar export chaperone FliS [Pseudomonas sp. LjRoot71]|uniref:flagellar export chaperone FliS n=1 Tax=Pseudomonas sp. LjRoot71 TaxID=3342336 RepID=UPI003ED0E1C9